MTKRYRLPLFTTRIGLPTGSKEAASDGWFYPKDAAEEAALVEAGCEADDLNDPVRNDGTLRPDEVLQFRTLVSGAGKTVVVLLPGASSAAANTSAIQAALNQGGTVALRVLGGGQAFISSTLRIGSNTTLEAYDVELVASGVMGSMLTTKAFADAGTTVTMSWSSGMTAGVAWTGHGRSVGDWVWLNRADQAQFCGVFRVDAVTDANNFTVRLQRIPTTAPTGTITARVAHTSVKVLGGRWNYNKTGGNSGTGSALHAIVLAGVWDVTADELFGIDTFKYLLCLGAVNKYNVSRVGGNALGSDTVKVYGPAFGGHITAVGSGQGADDLLSFQTREPSAYVAYDFCHGDIIGAAVDGLHGSSSTGTILVYASPFGVIDGLTVSAAASSLTGATPQCRIESLYTTGTSEVGTITLDGLVAGDANSSLLSLGNGSGTLVIRNVVLQNPVLRSVANSRRLVDVIGTNVSATVTILGGYCAAHDNIVNNGSNAGTVTINCYGLRTTSGWQGFRGGSAGVLNLNLHDVLMENNLGGGFITTPAGTGVINLRCTGAVSPSAPTFSLGAGSFLRLSGVCNLQIDGAILDSTVANHAPGASFYNTNAAFGAGVGGYVRGATAWVRVAA